MSKLSIRASAIVIAAGMALAACGGGSDSGGESEASITVAEATVESDPPTSEPPAATSPPATDPPPEQGDEPLCATIISEGEYEPIDCAEPHDAEFAGFATTTSDPSTDDDPAFGFELVGLCSDAVSALTSRPSALFGIDVGPVHDADSGGQNNVECWAKTSTPASLTGSLQDVDLEAALGDYTLVVAMDPGTCYLEPEAGFDVGIVTECSDPDVVQLVAVVTSTLDEFDGDAISDDGFAMCEQEIAGASFELIGTSYSLLSPLEEGWRSLDRRTIVCLMERGADDVAEAPQADADQPCAGSADDLFPVIPCDQPHGAEFAGMIAPPVEVLPADSDEATAIMVTACRETVEEFVGRDLSRPGIGVGFSVPSALGEAITEDVPCFVSTSTEDALLGSIADGGLAAALSKIIIADQEPGTCFFLGTDNFSFGDPADCSAPDALMFIGNVQLDDGPFLGDDAIREIRSVVCAELLASSGLAADPATVSGTFPGEGDWNNLERRNLACDATPLS